MMNSFTVLLRGINVGGKNKVPMMDLKNHLEAMACQDVVTYIQSGNVVLKSNLDAKKLGQKIEKMLSQKFKLDSESIKVLVLTEKQLKDVIDKKPKGFGEKPEKYHSDVIFLIDIDADEAFKVFKPREGVDKVWLGEGVIYSQRLSAMRTKSRLNRIMVNPAYKSMTIRNWNTTTKLLSIMQESAK